MHEQALTLAIKLVEEAHLEALEHDFSPDTLSKPPYMRYEVQKRGEGVYLITRHEHIPAGHFFAALEQP